MPPLGRVYCHEYFAYFQSHWVLSGKYALPLNMLSTFSIKTCGAPFTKTQHSIHNMPLIYADYPYLSRIHFI
jgi:hypothetical protein